MDDRVLVPGEAEEADLPIPQGLDAGLDCSVLLEDKVRVVVVNHLVELPKVDPIGLETSEAVFEIGLSLFDMEKDPYESTNVLENHPEMAARLQAYAAGHRQKFYAQPE